MSDNADGDALSNDGSMPDGEAEKEEPAPVRRALDLLVFAPVGMALTVVEDLPSLIVKGRQRFETDIRNARVIGEFVVTHGQRGVLRRVGKLLHGKSSGPTDGPSRAASPDGGPSGAPGVTVKPVTPAPPAVSPKPDPDPADGAIVEGALAGYDTLSASQVVRRLESLGPDELRAVHRHEASHRHRRTILNRAHQLLEGSGANNAAAPSPADAAREPDRSVE